MVAKARIGVLALQGDFAEHIEMLENLSATAVKVKKHSDLDKLEKYLFNHQIKKKFQYSLAWEKNQLAIWDNRSMLHQATPFKGNRIMHRITIY